MAYSIQKAKDTADKILNNKRHWHIANNVKHWINGKDARDYYADDAKKYYKELRDNGYGALADNLQSSDYAKAEKVRNDYFIKTGRSQFRPYMYEQAKAYGLDKDYIDNLTSFDNTTGEVTFAGKNIGKPAGIVDGTSYFDPEYLKGVWNSHVADSGIHRSDEDLAGINSEETRNKINKTFDITLADRDVMLEKTGRLEDYNYNHNPYETERGKSIMADYQLQGDNAGRNEIASGASSNSGNIDSFAAANAKRQQLAFTNAGKQAVLADFNSRISNARGILSELGVQLKDIREDAMEIIALQQNEAQRQFTNSEDRKNNEVARESENNAALIEQAKITGYVPVEWQLKNDPFLSGFVDESGKLKDEYKDTDFQALINYAKERGDTATADKYAILRGLKFRDHWNDFKQYAAEGDIKYLEPMQTSEHFLTKYGIDANERMNKDNNQTAKDVAFDTNAKNLEGIKDTNNTTENVTKEQVKGATDQTKIQADASNYAADKNSEDIRYQVDNMPTETGSKNEEETVYAVDGTKYTDEYINGLGEDTLAYKALQSLKSHAASNTIAPWSDAWAVSDIISYFVTNSKKLGITDLNKLYSILGAMGIDSQYVSNVKVVDGGTNDAHLVWNK